jgi:hypothetical protein
MFRWIIIHEIKIIVQIHLIVRRGSSESETLDKTVCHF